MSLTTVIVSIMFVILGVSVRGNNEQPLFNDAHGRIVGGRSASYKYRRGVALIFLYRNQVAFKHCTASILSDRFLLTAAHCLTGFMHERLGVLPTAFHVGKAFTVTIPENAHYIKKAYIHKFYKTKTVTGDRRFDIALVELEAPLPHGTFTRVRIVPPPKRASRVMALGYGAIGEHRRTSRVLQEAPVVARPFNWCIAHEQFSDKYEVVSQEHHFCATSVQYPLGRTDTCYGDSGGPLLLIFANSDKLHQVGITSFSFSECAAPGSTPWYIKAVYFKQAILKLVTKGRYRGTWLRYRVGLHRIRS